MSTPSFYCENCSREVSSGLDICPGCGQKFSSVRCPSCGFTGESELFDESCPECGYVGTDNISKNPGSNFYIVKTPNKKSVRSKRSENQLPSWLYKVLIGFMIIIFIGLIRIYFLL